MYIAIANHRMYRLVERKILRQPVRFDAPPGARSGPYHAYQVDEDEYLFLSNYDAVHLCRNQDDRYWTMADDQSYHGGRTLCRGLSLFY